MNEVALWLGRIIGILPEVKHLWDAVKAEDDHAATDAAMALRRKISDAQMREELG